MGWDYDIGSNAVVKCICGGENCHPLRVVVNQGGEIAHVDAEGVTCEKGEPSGRGTSIGIEFACEDCTSTHVVAYQFHKGRTHTGRAPGVPDHHKIGEPIAAMWRD